MTNFRSLGRPSRHRRRRRKAPLSFEGHLERSHRVLVKGISVERLHGEARVPIVAKRHESEPFSRPGSSFTHHEHLTEGS